MVLTKDQVAAVISVISRVCSRARAVYNPIEGEAGIECMEIRPGQSSLCAFFPQGGPCPDSKDVELAKLRTRLLQLSQQSTLSST